MSADEILAANREWFIESYIECALWSSNDESREDGGDPLDDNYGPEDLSPECMATMRADCERFLIENAETLASVKLLNEARYGRYPSAGHDFWLTRNGHGAGFWDGDWSEPEATALTAASKSFGEIHLYVGDDGKIGCE